MRFCAFCPCASVTGDSSGTHPGFASMYDLDLPPLDRRRGDRVQKRTLNRYLQQFRSMRSQIILAVALSLVVAPSTAADFTYKEYAKAAEPWKRGFVFGISRYVTAVAQPDEEAPYPVRAAFQRCLADATDVLLARHVEAYVAKNSAGSKGPMVTVVVRALFDFCRREIEKLKSQPSPR